MNDQVITSQAPVVRAAWVRVPPIRAFEAFTEEIGAWWPLPTHGLFGPRAGGLSFRDGLLVEQSTSGEEVVWGEVVAWEPPARFVLSWHPGRDRTDASEVEVSFEPSEDGTRVLIEHRGWERFGADAAARRHSYVGPGAWGHVLDHFADLADVRPDRADLAPLRAAYDAFLAEARQDGHGEPPPGEWDADQVIAHVTLSDAATVAVCHALIHGEPARFANQECQDRVALAAWIESCGSRQELLARAAHAADLALAALGRLSAAQLETPVPCHLTHDGQVVLDEPRPWATIAIGAQTHVHLPAHVGQLRDLREGGDPARGGTPGG